MDTSKLGKHQSIYIEETQTTKYPMLNEDMNVDIAIIGGGIVGLTLAYLLRNTNQKVVVLEANQIAMGMSARTTAKLTPCHGLIYDQLTHTKSPGKAKQYLEINQMAMEIVKSIIEKEKIECDFKQSPSYVYTTEEQGIRYIKNEIETCRRLGLRLQYKESLSIGLPVKAALELEEAYIFHIRKYLLKLAEIFVEAGGVIYEHTPIQIVESDEVTGLEAKNGAYIHAKKIIIASHFPVYDGLGLYFTRLQMRREYVIAVKVSKDKMPKGNYISIDQPKFSIRPVPEKDVVLIGGGEHRTGDDMKEVAHFDELVQFAQTVFGSDEVLCHWSTQDYVTSDSVPYVGYLNSRLSHDVYVATGFNKWGMTGGTAAALVLKDMLTVGRSPYEELFNPMRTEAFTGQIFVKNNVIGIKNYIQGKLHQVPKSMYPEKGQAITTRLEDGNIYGIYQDEEAYYHIVELTCPHVGARLRWNSAEKSWDCPFHGSRFSIDGEVLEGPATHTLNSYKEGKNKIHPNIIEG